MARRAFFSFHYKPDNWRASQVRNTGVIEGNRPVSDNDWETIAGQGDYAIKRWIDGQLADRSCAVVLVGTQTASRKWVNYEIDEAWKKGMGVVGVHIHGLKDASQNQSTKGSTPFNGHLVGLTPMSLIVKLYDTPYSASTKVYEYIKENLAAWTDEACTIRAKY
jgi:hypothetical protein